jgi:cytochrome c peroxidase
MRDISWKRAGLAACLGLASALTGCGGDTAGPSDVAVPKPAAANTDRPAPASPPSETPAVPSEPALDTPADAGKPAEAVPGGAAAAPGHAPAVGVKPIAHSAPASSPVFDALPLVALVKPVAASSVVIKPDEDSVYWQPADSSLIQDEPLEVKPPRGLPDLTPGVVVPEANPLTKGKFELGRLLYFDPRVSKDGTVSCATCHDPGEGWTKGTPTAIGIAGQAGGRNAPVVTNTAYGRTMFWDGRAPSLEAQSQGPPLNPIEMGDQTYEEIIGRLRDVPDYVERFRRVFGTNVTLDGVAKAIATFERVAGLSGDSSYDRYRDYDDPDHNKALSESEKRGMVLFGERLNDDDEFQTDVVLQKARCTLCHQGFNFTDEKFHNLGVGYDAATGKFADYGRFLAEPIGAKNPASIGAFKTPTVRDAARSAPYMHDGSEATLEAVIDYYDRGGNPNPYLDKDMKPLNLTPQEKTDLVAFMRALTGSPVSVDIPALPPNSEGKAPDARQALEIPKRKVAADDAHGILRLR